MLSQFSQIPIICCVRDISTRTQNKNWSMIVLTKLTDKIFRLNLRKQWAYDSWRQHLLWCKIWANWTSLDEVVGEISKILPKQVKIKHPKYLNRHFTSGLVKIPWTNNNSESLNHIFKQSINWKSQPHSNLICTLTSIIETQFRTWESTRKDWSIQTLRNLKTLLSIKDCMDLKIL